MPDAYSGRKLLVLMGMYEQSLGNCQPQLILSTVTSSCFNILFSNLSNASDLGRAHIETQADAGQGTETQHGKHCVTVAYPGILFGWGVQQIQLRAEDRQNGDLAPVAT